MVQNTGIDQPDDTPLVFRKADLLKTAKTAQAVVGAVQEVQAATTGGGFDFDRLITFVEKMMPSLLEAGQQYERLFKLAKDSKAVVNESNAVGNTTEQPEPPQPRIPTVIIKPLNPELVYQKALGALNAVEEYQPGITVAQALTRAREMKPILVQQIAKHLEELQRA